MFHILVADDDKNPRALFRRCRRANISGEISPKWGERLLMFWIGSVLLLWFWMWDAQNGGLQIPPIAAKQK